MDKPHSRESHCQDRVEPINPPDSGRPDPGRKRVFDSPCPPANQMTARDQVSAVGEEGCSGCGDVTRDRDRLFLAGVAATASCATSADLDAPRDRPRMGFTSE